MPGSLLDLSRFEPGELQAARLTARAIHGAQLSGKGASFTCRLLARLDDEIARHELKAPEAGRTFGRGDYGSEA
jgi:hypothetical protein